MTGEKSEAGKTSEIREKNEASETSEVSEGECGLTGSKEYVQMLKEYAYSIGIDLLGITTAEPFPEAYNRLERIKAKGYLSPWAAQDSHTRCTPRLLMEDAQSLLAVGIVYPVWADNPVAVPPYFTAKLARFARYLDYHQVLRKKMEELVSFIRQKYPQVQAQIFVDTGPLIDREVAYRAGLGFIGKNAALINPQYGSFFALGEILLNLSLEPDQPLKDGCGDCDLCLKACPQQAIKAPGEIHSTNCLAHFTQEKGILPLQVRQKMGNRLWGCDMCQDVCPYNRVREERKKGDGCAGMDGETSTGPEVSMPSVFSVHGLGQHPDLARILALSNQEYKELVGETAMAWRGKTVLQRNALINLGNIGDVTAIPILVAALKDARPVIRATAAWALRQIGGEEARFFLTQALVTEKDALVRAEIRADE